MIGQYIACGTLIVAVFAASVVFVSIQRGAWAGRVFLLSILLGVVAGMRLANQVFFAFSAADEPLRLLACGQLGTFIGGLVMLTAMPKSKDQAAVVAAESLAQALEFILRSGHATDDARHVRIEMATELAIRHALDDFNRHRDCPCVTPENPPDGEALSPSGALVPARRF